jgi:hypothetical protein
MESLCRYFSGASDPKTYNLCISDKLFALETNVSPDLRGIAIADLASMEIACANYRAQGPGAYNLCLSTKLDALRLNPPPDMSTLSKADRDKIEARCSSEYVRNGPGAYYSCLARNPVQNTK